MRSCPCVLSAVQLHDDGLTLRRDMVETIGQMNDPPRDEQIAAWLENFSDQEMLARMRQLKPTATYDPDVVLSNVAVLEAMRDDAGRFVGLPVEQA